MTSQGVIFVVYTERDEGNIIRLISARKAEKHEKLAYEKGSFLSLGKEA